MLNSEDNLQVWESVQPVQLGLNIVSGSSGSYLVNLDYNDGTDGGGFSNQVR